MVQIKHEDKKVKAILELWRKGLTGKQIGEKLGMTRSAVLGKIGRLRKWGLAEYRDPAAKKNATADEKLHKKLRNPVVPNLRKKKLPPLPPVSETVQAVKLMDLKLHSCRFVINDSLKASEFIFCGSPSQKDSSYCEEHHRICYIKAEPRKRDKPRKPFQLNPRYSEAK